MTTSTLDEAWFNGLTPDARRAHFHLTNLAAGVANTLNDMHTPAPTVQIELNRQVFERPIPADASESDRRVHGEVINHLRTLLGMAKAQANPARAFADLATARALSMLNAMDALGERP